MPPEIAIATPAADGLAERWAALHDAADLVASLAGLAPEPNRAEVIALPLRLGPSAGWRAHLVEQGIEDIAAIMEPGIAALLALRGRGAEAGPAALALWQEFRAARAALLGLVPPGAMIGHA